MPKRRRKIDPAIAQADLSELDATDRQILQMKMANRRLTLEQIGRVIGISRAAVHKRIHKKRFKRLFDEFDKDVLQRIKDQYSEAFFVYQTVMRDASNPSLQFRAARDLVVPLIKSQGMLPAPPDIGNLEFIDPDEPQVKQ